MAMNEQARRGSGKRAHGKTTELHGDRPSGYQKLNLATATRDEIKGVVNQVSNERADTLVRYVQFARAENQMDTDSVAEFLGQVPGFGPKLIDAFDKFCYIDWTEERETETQAREREAREENA